MGLILLGLSMTATLTAQKRAMTIDDVMAWQRISHQALSDDGRWALTVSETWRGDGDRNGNISDYSGDATARLYDAQGHELTSFWPINGFAFSHSSDYLVISLHESEAQRHDRLLSKQNDKGAAQNDKGGDRRAKGKGRKGGKGTDGESLLDTLLLCQPAAGMRTERIDSVRNYKVSAWADYMAYQLHDSDSTLYVRSLGGDDTLHFGHVTEYGFAKHGNVMYYTTLLPGLDDKGHKAPDTCRIYLLTLGEQLPRLVKEGIGQQASRLTLSDDGKLLAYLWGTSDKRVAKDAGKALYLGDRLVSDSTNAVLADGWVISGNRRLDFSKDGKRLFFGYAPAPRQQDTLTLAQDRADVEVWSADEAEQYTVQKFEFGRDSQRTALALYDITADKVIVVSRDVYDEVMLDEDRLTPYALVSNNRKYNNSSMWEGRSRHDMWRIDLSNGERKDLLPEATYCRYRLSPGGHYAYGYSQPDSAWLCIDMATATPYTLTQPGTLTAWDEENDVPDYPSEYAPAQWLDDDAALIICDRYDLWRVSPQGGDLKRLTLDGRERQIQYRLLQLDPEKRGHGIAARELQYLSGYCEADKTTACYTLPNLSKPAVPALLQGGNGNVSIACKAKEAPVVLWSMQRFDLYPEMQRSMVSKNGKALTQTCQLTRLGRQMEDYKWGTAELVSWKSYKGVELQGILLKPADFDANRRYPMFVYYYERYSQSLHDFRTPAPGRSAPDFHVLTSNDYIVFIPDIRYVDGHPGESCYDCVMSGIDYVEGLGFVDHEHIGTGGHSWGGYQSAYLATRTDRFACIESGAPVVNMFSAYGGIRWGSGKARSFQYEHTQSRIGASPWEAPELYTENSSIFNMDKVTTPILIMHNDADGHVPWYQGIEYFVALKRLGKQAWLLNYTGEPHWPVKMANRVDFQRRYLQFLNHFLKDEPAPKWMSEGRPAVDAPYEMGY